VVQAGQVDCVADLPPDGAGDNGEDDGDGDGDGDGADCRSNDGESDLGDNGERVWPGTLEDGGWNDGRCDGENCGTDDWGGNRPDSGDEDREYFRGMTTRATDWATGRATTLAI
jgi:hypothetical protein